MKPVNRRHRNRPRLPAGLSPEEAARIAKEKEYENKLNAPVAELRLSLRVLNGLESGVAIKTVSGLLNAEYDHLKNLPNFGDKTLVEIANAIERFIPEELGNCRWLRYVRENAANLTTSSKRKINSRRKTKSRQPLSHNEAVTCLSQIHRKARALWPRLERLLRTAHSDARNDFAATYRSLNASDLSLGADEQECVETFIEPNVVLFGGRFYQNYHALAVQGAAWLLSAMRDAENLVFRLHQNWNEPPRFERRRLQHESAAIEVCKSVTLLGTDVGKCIMDEHEKAKRELPSRLDAIKERTNNPEPVRKKSAAERELRRRVQQEENATRDKRDDYAYKRHQQGALLREIIKEINECKTWPQLTKAPSLLRAIRAYARRNHLPLPKARKSYMRRRPRRPRGAR